MAIKIGLLSDSHGFTPRSVFKYFKDVDEIWHGGDIGTMAVLEELEKFKPVRAIWGNIDGAEIRVAVPEKQVFEIEGLKVCMIHIGGYPPNYNATTKPWLLAEKPNLFICGHSHILKVIKDPALNCLHLNPGACGNQGWHKVKTIMRFTIEDGVIKSLEVIELLGDDAK
jgi:uncharacterized protein